MFRRKRFFSGKPASPDDKLDDIEWFNHDGHKMTDGDWDAAKSGLVIFLNGEGISDLDPRGEPVTDDSFLLAFNAYHEDTTVTLPGAEYGSEWAVVIDTGSKPHDDEDTLGPGAQFTLPARTTMLLQRKESA